MDQVLHFVYVGEGELGSSSSLLIFSRANRSNKIADKSTFPPIVSMITLLCYSILSYVII